MIKIRDEIVHDEVEFEFEDIRQISKEYFIPDLYRILPADFILDVGCGLGQFLELCRIYNIKAVGIDLSKRALIECKNRDVEVVKGRLEDPFPFKNNTFDAIYCNQVIEHIQFDRQDSLFRECHRVLKPNGKAFFRSPCKYNPAESSKKGHIALITPSILKNKLLLAGFEEIDLSLNYPRKIKGIPHALLNGLFHLSKSNKIPPNIRDTKLLDFFSASAHAIAYKGVKK